jgi:hypothetical protein
MKIWFALGAELLSLAHGFRSSVWSMNDRRTYRASAAVVGAWAYRGELSDSPNVTYTVRLADSTTTAGSLAFNLVGEIAGAPRVYAALDRLDLLARGPRADLRVLARYEGDARRPGILCSPTLWPCQAGNPDLLPRRRNITSLRIPGRVARASADPPLMRNGWARGPLDWHPSSLVW